MRKIEVIFGIISQAKLPCPQNAAISLYNSCVINEWLAFQWSNCILILHILHRLRNRLKSYTRNWCFFVTIIKCLAFVMLFKGDVLCIRKTVFTTSRDFGIMMPTYNNSGLPESKPNSEYKNVPWIILNNVKNYTMYNNMAHFPWISYKMKQNNGCPKFKKLSEFICTSVFKEVPLLAILTRNIS